MTINLALYLLIPATSPRELMIINIINILCMYMYVYLIIEVFGSFISFFLFWVLSHGLW